MEYLSNRDLTMKVELPDPKLICPSSKPVSINAWKLNVDLAQGFVNVIKLDYEKQR